MRVVDIVFEDNHDLAEILAKKAMPKKEYFTVPTDDGDGRSSKLVVRLCHH